MCTVRVLVSTDPLLTHAVLDVLPRMRFFPAEGAGRKVRQRLELPVEFRLSRRRSP
jgi:outer membrane biosynthesis protein TonB